MKTSRTNKRKLFNAWQQKYIKSQSQWEISKKKPSQSTSDRETNGELIQYVDDKFKQPQQQKKQNDKIH